MNKRIQQPFYNPTKSYEENYNQGPFGAFTEKKIFKDKQEPKDTFLGQQVHLPFGIPAGPLLNGNFVKAALDRGFDLPVYKTVRTKKRACAPFPNVLSVNITDNLTFTEAEQGIIANKTYSKNNLSITNSFGVPSFDPDIWQPDMKKAVKYAKTGQVVIGSFQGTTNTDGDTKAYIQDFVTAARLVKETGTKILEVNFSCPNEGTANLLCFDIKRVQQIVEAIKNEIGETPLIIKTAYYKTDEELTKLLKAIGNTIQGIAAINTIPAKIVNDKGEQALPGKGRERSGVCGHAIKWAGLDMTKRLHNLRKKFHQTFAIIGVGGVTTPEDYREYKEAGADAVMSATGAMWNPYLAQEIKQALYSHE
jgi:dihydroorotate dehydrogenase (NAD+) catalytic subunit